MPNPTGLPRGMALALFIAVAGCSGPPPCNRDTCSGCCYPDGYCNPATSDSECGTEGALCAPCPSDQQCIYGNCTPKIVNGCASGQTCGFLVQTWGNGYGSAAACEEAVSGPGCMIMMNCASLCPEHDNWIACLPPDGNVCGNACCASSTWGGGMLSCTCR
jgi:hypothetical protein